MNASLSTSQVTLYVVLRADQPCGCCSFHVLRLNDYCTTPELAVADVVLIGVYISQDAACQAADQAVEAVRSQGGNHHA